MKTKDHIREEFKKLPHEEKLKLTQFILEDSQHLWHGFKSMLNSLAKYNNLTEKQLDLIYNISGSRNFSLFHKATAFHLNKSYNKYLSDNSTNNFVNQEDLKLNNDNQNITNFKKDKNFYLKDAKELVSVPENWGLSFDKFNPIQSAIWPYRNDDCNFIISASTSAGKTIVAEEIMNDALTENPCCFLSPLKAVTKEKEIDWTSPEHRWKDHKISIVTGDYVLSVDRKDELNNSNLILMTTEMLLSRVRNLTSEKSQWLKKVHTLVIDESHLIGVDKRGDISEIGLVDFTQLNPNCRIVMLSATMPNSEEIRRWLTLLNGKKTLVLESSFRPTQLENKFIPIRWTNYKDFQEAMACKVEDIITEHNNSKHIVFCHTKALVKKIHDYIPNSEMYSSGVSKSKREKILDRFENGDLNVIISTSALAWGINSPAEIVTICGVHRGQSLVQNVDIKQMQGRAGRIGKCSQKGLSYTLLPQGKPENSFENYVRYCKETNPTKSQITSDNMIFHLLGAIKNKIVRNKSDIKIWCSRTLAYFTGLKIDFDRVINELKKYKAIDEDIDGYKLLPIGKIAGLMFFYPQDVFKLYINLNNLDKYALNDELQLSIILGDLFTNNSFLNSLQKKELLDNPRFNKLMKHNCIANIYSYWCLINNKYSSGFFNNMQCLEKDLGRLETVCLLIDKLFCMEKEKLIINMFLRFRYRIPYEMLPLAEVKGIGGKRLLKLKEFNIKSIPELLTLNTELVKKIFKSKKVYDSIIKNIR